MFDQLLSAACKKRDYGDATSDEPLQHSNVCSTPEDGGRQRPENGNHKFSHGLRAGERQLHPKIRRTIQNFEGAEQAKRASD
ncbi:MAG TPA: hypothetical protein VGB05_01570 [Pyrinomonadaceae bacterium]|jgi:hypothetical protein